MKYLLFAALVGGLLLTNNVEIDKINLAFSLLGVMRIKVEIKLK